MPTVLKIGPFRFFFCSNENGEPTQTHTGTPQHTPALYAKLAASIESSQISVEEVQAIKQQNQH